MLSPEIGVAPVSTNFGIDSSNLYRAISALKSSLHVPCVCAPVLGVESDGGSRRSLNRQETVWVEAVEA